MTKAPRPAGPGADIGLSAGSATSDSSQFSSASFTATPAAGELTGGAWGGYTLSGVAYAPDGDVISADDSVNGNWAYQYGPLNRLVQATCSANCPGGQSSQGLQYSYDRFGNLWDRTVTAGAGPPFEISFDGNNHIVGANYDAAGDLTAEGSQTFTFDAEGRISSADNGAVKYVYDAFGHRVETVTPAGTFYFLHDLDGRPVTELNTSGQWVRGEVYAGGKHLATYNNGIFFDYSDWLGTERVRATAAGDENDQCTSLPFGDSLSCAGPGADPSPMRQYGGIHCVNSFTGKAHDATTGLEHFPARYYTGQLGFWISPDPDGAGADVSDPETWNAYSYALGSPSTLTDPGGANVRVCVDNDSGKGQNCYTLSNDQYADIFRQQNGNQGIDLPGGTFPSGNITCQGRICGSAHYVPAGVTDDSLSLFFFADGAASLARAGIEGLMAAGARLIGRDAVPAATGAAVTTAAPIAAQVISDPAVVVARAVSAVGNEEITVASREVAESAAQRYIGRAPRAIRAGRGAGGIIGQISENGDRVVRWTSAGKSQPYLNFENRITDSNINVRW